jgi:hypothetical protein
MIISPKVSSWLYTFGLVGAFVETVNAIEVTEVEDNGVTEVVNGIYIF